MLDRVKGCLGNNLLDMEDIGSLIHEDEQLHFPVAVCTVFDVLVHPWLRVAFDQFTDRATIKGSYDVIRGWAFCCPEESSKIGEFILFAAALTTTAMVDRLRRG